MRILIVKTSSMGDVVHAVPVVSDIRAQFPEAEIDWLVEGSFADIPRQTEGVNAVVECAVRRWRRELFSSKTWSQISDLKRTLRSRHYDIVIDLQGLIKSAVLASMTKAPVSGYDRHSIKEPAASGFYKNCYAVGRSLSAVERCRFLCADALGYERPKTEPIFAFRCAKEGTRSKTAFFFCNTSRETKLWPEADWGRVGTAAAEKGFEVILPWGSEAERERVLRIQNLIGSAAAKVPERMSIGKLMEAVSAASAVVGLDTGMTHLSSAMGVPTVGIFRDYPIELVPLMGAGPKKALGGVNARPSAEEVISALEEVTR